MDLSLKGRVALITGPAKGMGAAVSKAFAAEGCSMALAGRDTLAIEPVAADVRARGGKALIVACDVTDAGRCESAVAAAIAAYGRLDILVNVAGG
ncbi:MAG: SDR family NAD(P)-dependent oxidoreductase, partial [Xanthobacteraceae bacterium]|nr:SDR family NAD(P)-dependent oxidoreductase [Xanthobacteraceae bacterium]